MQSFAIVTVISALGFFSNVSLRRRTISFTAMLCHVSNNGLESFCFVSFFFQMLNSGHQTISIMYQKLKSFCHWQRTLFHINIWSRRSLFFLIIRHFFIHFVSHGPDTTRDDAGNLLIVSGTVFFYMKQKNCIT